MNLLGLGAACSRDIAAPVAIVRKSVPQVKVLTETYALAEITSAYERVEQGKVHFRSVINMGDQAPSPEARN